MKGLLLKKFHLTVFIYSDTAQARKLPNHILGAGSRVIDLLMLDTLLSSINEEERDNCQITVLYLISNIYLYFHRVL